MQFTLQICISIFVLFYYTDAAPRMSWGSFANFEQLLSNNKTALCTKDQCVHWAECNVRDEVSKIPKICSNKSGGPWICCLDIPSEYSQRKEGFNLETSNTSTSEDINPQNSSFVSIVHIIKENELHIDESDILKYNDHDPENITSSNEGKKYKVHAIPFNENENHLLMNHRGETVQRIGTENTNDITVRNLSSGIKISKNETVFIPLNKNQDEILKNTLESSYTTQNETAVYPGLYPSNIAPDNETNLNQSGDTVNQPIAENQVYYPEYMHRHYPNSNYYWRRRNRNTTPPRRKSTWGDWNYDYDLNIHKSRTTYKETQTTSLSWYRSTKRTRTENRPSSYERKSSTSSNRPTKRSRDNGHTSSGRKTTKNNINAHTAHPASVEYRTTTLSLRKPTTKRIPTVYLDKRSTKTTPTLIFLSNPTKQPSAPIPGSKITSSGAPRTTPQTRRKPAPWNRHITAPSGIVSSGLWSSRRTSHTPTKQFTDAPTVTRFTTASSRRSPSSRNPTPTESNSAPGINTRMCGFRRDLNNVTSRSGRSAENHPDSLIIFPSSVNSTGRERKFQRIVGGTEAEPYSWPWVAALYKVTSSGGNRFLSAGSLISESFVLTAAHVFTPEDLRTASFVVMLGTHTSKVGMAEYPVRSVVRHPGYQQRYYYNDIALLRLARPVVFNNYVMPVCLPVYRTTDGQMTGTRVTVMGWGDDSYGGITSRVLKEATFPIVSRSTCNAAYIRVASNRFPRGITDNMLCAGAPDGGKDACQGDSGGPLTTTRNGRHILLGIVSFGYRCGDREYPGVYTRVASFLEWIDENTRCDDDYYYGR